MLMFYTFMRLAHTLITVPGAAAAGRDAHIVMLKHLKEETPWTHMHCELKMFHAGHGTMGAHQLGQEFQFCTRIIIDTY
jgi:hypothetical protein